MWQLPFTIYKQQLQQANMTDEYYAGRCNKEYNKNNYNNVTINATITERKK